MEKMDERTCRTCSGHIREDETCNCWCMLAMVLQQYLGVGHDDSADLALRLWQEEADKDSVFGGVFLNTHAMTACER